MLVFLMLLSVSLGHDLATLGALVVHAGARYLVESKLARFNVFRAHWASFCLNLCLI